MEKRVKRTHNDPKVEQDPQEEDMNAGTTLFDKEIRKVVNPKQIIEAMKTFDELKSCTDHHPYEPLLVILQITVQGEA